MKYSRMLNGRTIDVTDTADYEPRPTWGQTDEELLDRIFEAVGGFGAFIVVPDYVQPGMVDNGDGSYSYPAPVVDAPNDQ